MTVASVLGSVVRGVPSPALGEGVGNIITSIFADGTDGFYYNFSTLSKLWQDTSATTPVAAAGNSIARSDDSSPRGRNATQATTAAQPKYQTGGLARFDGTDDNLLTTLNLSSAFTLLVKMKPTTGAGAQIVAGSAAAASTQIWLGTNGANLAANVGGTLLSGATSVNGSVVVAGVRADGAAIDLFSQGTAIASGTTAGTPNTTIPVRLGGYNNNGTASNFFIGDIYHALAIKKALTAAQIASITNYWGTS